MEFVGPQRPKFRDLGPRFISFSSQNTAPLCKVTKSKEPSKPKPPKFKPVVDGRNIPEGMRPIQDAQTKINNIVVDPKNHISRPSHEPGLFVVPPEIHNQRIEQANSSPEHRVFLQAESRRADHSRAELAASVTDSAKEMGFSQWATYTPAQKKDHLLTNELFSDLIPKKRREASREAAETNRLVNTRECPTRDSAVNKAPSVARIYAREWSGETRVSIESFLRDGKAPDPVTGDRWTETLTAKGVRAIIDSGAYVSVMRGGYTTFLTLTLDNEARERVNRIKPMVIMGKKGDEAGEIKAAGQFCHIGVAGDFCNGEIATGQFVPVDFTSESTIGREVSRFFDGMQKMYQRGAKLTNSGDLFSDLPPSSYVDVKHSDVGPVPVREKLDYMWVAENPMKQVAIPSDAGPSFEMKNNPHVHVLMRWRVSRNLFEAWAERIENIWGQGFAHIEKIHTPEAGAGYLLKAASYLTKASHVVNPVTGEIYPSQGVIRGNRYNISQVARAPKFECVAEFQAEEMSRIVYETGRYLQGHHERLKQQIQEAREGKKSNVADIAVIKKLHLPEKTKHNKIRAAEIRIKKAEARINALCQERKQSPYGNKFRVTVKSQTQFAQLLHNAVVQRGWKPNAITTEFRKSAHWAIKGVPEWFDKFGSKVREQVEYQLRDLEIYESHLMNTPMAPSLNGVAPAPELGVRKVEIRNRP